MTVDSTLPRRGGSAAGRPAGSAWSALHLRSAVLRDVVAAVEAGAELPWDDRLAAVFGDRDELLRALHELWGRRLDGRIDIALETDDQPLADAVADAWLATVEDLPGVRRVLDEHADEPGLRQLERAQLRAVAVAAGLATFADPIAVSATAGARFVRRLSEGARPRARLSPWSRWWRSLR